MAFYAVASGLRTGVFRTWAEAERAVKGVAGARFKKFTNEADAQMFITTPTSSSFLPSTSVFDTSLPKPCPYYNVVYTDGSGRNNGGFGVVITTCVGDIYTAHGRLPGNGGSAQLAEIYAVFVALSLAAGDMIICTDSKYAITVSERMHHWKQQGWSSNGKPVAHVDLINHVYNLTMNRNISYRHVRAHTGVPYNEMADSLAGAGAGGRELLIIKKNEQEMRRI